MGAPYCLLGVKSKMCEFVAPTEKSDPSEIKCRVTSHIVRDEATALQYLHRFTVQVNWKCPKDLENQGAAASYVFNHQSVLWMMEPAKRQS